MALDSIEHDKTSHSMPHKEQQFLVHIILLRHFNMSLYNILSSFEAKKYQLLVLVKPTP